MPDDGQDIRLIEIFSEIDKLMWDNAWDEITDLMYSEPIEDQHIDQMIGYLTASLPAKRQIPCRPSYFQAVRAEMIRRAEGRKDIREAMVDVTLRGLE